MTDADSVIIAAHLATEIRGVRQGAPAVPSAPAAATGGEPVFRLHPDEPLPAAVERLERQMVEAANKRADGRMEEATRMLAISRKGLFLKRRRMLLTQRLLTPRAEPAERLAIFRSRVFRSENLGDQNGARWHPISSWVAP